MRQPLTLLRRLLIMTVFALPGAVQAAGFALIEHGASGMGNAFAGGSAIAEDATTVYFNPAGMTRLEGTRFTLGAHAILPSAKFNGTDMRTLSVLGLGSFMATNSGGEGGDAGKFAVVPNLYYVRDLNERVKFGLGINVPFGLATEYDDEWVGRYHAIESELMTININPSLAFKATDKLSLGVGINAQYSNVLLTSAVDGGLIGALQNGCTAVSLAFCDSFSGIADFMGEVDGNDWGWGYNLGLLYEFNENTRVGLAYRSRIKFNLEGEAEFEGISPLGPIYLGQFQAAGAFVNSDVEASITHPDTLSLSLFHQINPKWAVMADITWTHWSLLKEVVIEFDRGSQGNSTLEFGWENTLRYALGVNYRHNANWLWRAGVAYDETPIPNAEMRSPRIPDEDRLWVNIGFNYRLNDEFSIDVGYAHLFVDDAKINNTTTANPVPGVIAIDNTLTGEYDSHTDILSAQLNWTF